MCVPKTNIDSLFINYHLGRLRSTSPRFEIKNNRNIWISLFKLLYRDQFPKDWKSSTIQFFKKKTEYVMIKNRSFTFQSLWSSSTDYILKFLFATLLTLPLEYFISCRFSGSLSHLSGSLQICLYSFEFPRD